MINDLMFGQKFNRFTVLPVKSKVIKYRRFHYCKCECGTEKWIDTQKLKLNKTKSCGCLRKETSRQNQFINITGIRFGQLIAISYSHSNLQKQSVWLCKCDCGNEVKINGHDLQTGNTKSCGCFRKQEGGKKFTTYNQEYRISKNKNPDIPITEETKLERSKFTQSGIIKQVLKRDNYECQFCPNIYEDLEIHHILSWSKYPELRYELTNLITLCKICHVPIIHNKNIKIEPDKQTTLMLQDIIKRKTNVN